MNDTLQIVCALLAALAGLAFVRWRFDPVSISSVFQLATLSDAWYTLAYSSTPSQLSAHPHLFSHTWGHYRYFRHAPEVLQEGYSRVRPELFCYIG